MKTSSNEGDLVLDCFVGSGTTAAVAEKLNRRWITADLGRFAIHTTRKRLLSVPDVKPFVVQNLGKYERQLWQVAEFGDRAESRIEAYRKLILDLYHAEAINGYAWLHGVKAGRMSVSCPRGTIAASLARLACPEATPWVPNAAAEDQGSLVEGLKAS
jgi:adenine-specific DNA-methyltransferase